LRTEAAPQIFETPLRQFEVGLLSSEVQASKKGAPWGTPFLNNEKLEMIETLYQGSLVYKQCLFHKRQMVTF
jgi:hypothetical protein